MLGDRRKKKEREKEEIQGEGELHGADICHTALA